MIPDLTEYAKLGATAVVAIFAFYFMWQANKNKGGNGTAKETLNQIKLLNENHLNAICKEVKEGNQNVVQAINTMNKELGDKVDSLNAGIYRLIGRGDTK